MKSNYILQLKLSYHHSNMENGSKFFTILIKGKAHEKAVPLFDMKCNLDGEACNLSKKKLGERNVTIMVRISYDRIQFEIGTGVYPWRDADWSQKLRSKFIGEFKKHFPHAISVEMILAPKSKGAPRIALATRAVRKSAPVAKRQKLEDDKAEV